MKATSVLGIRSVVLPSKKTSLAVECELVRIRSPASTRSPTDASRQVSPLADKISTMPLTRSSVAPWAMVTLGQYTSDRPPTMHRTNAITRASGRASVYLSFDGLYRPPKRAASPPVPQATRLRDPAWRRCFSANASSILCFPAVKAAGLEIGGGTRRTSRATSSGWRSSLAYSG